MTYSLDFRQKVFAYKTKKGLTFEQTSEHFDIGIRTLFRWQSKIEPCSTRNKPAIKIDMEALAKDIQDSPDDYQWERAARFKVTQQAITKALRRLNISYKKTLYHPKACQEARAQFQQKMECYEQQGKSLIYLDESGFAKDMPRTHGYSQRGQRCYGQQDWHAKGRANAIGAIIDFAFLSVGLFNANIDADIFYTWLTQQLLPKLSLNSVIVMDNAAFHKRADIQEAVHKQGIILEYLPPYSPDLNPIEQKWAQAKSIRKKLGCNDIDLLFSQHLDYAVL